jgi:hypothetical protein
MHELRRGISGFLIKESSLVVGAVARKIHGKGPALRCLRRHIILPPSEHAARQRVAESQRPRIKFLRLHDEFFPFCARRRKFADVERLSASVEAQYGWEKGWSE